MKTIVHWWWRAIAEVSSIATYLLELTFQVGAGAVRVFVSLSLSLNEESLSLRAEQSASSIHGVRRVMRFETVVVEDIGVPGLQSVVSFHNQTCLTLHVCLPV